MLERVCGIARERSPAVVLSALWLASLLAGQVPVTVLVEAEKRRGARRAVRRAARDGQRLMVVAAGEELPVAEQRAGCILIENVSEIEDDAEAVEFLRRLAPTLRPDGVLLALDATKNPATEARLAALFLAAALTGIAQERPREGAVLTIGGPASSTVLAARLS
jgi:predicted O-methyltransferase YrrM